MADDRLQVACGLFIILGLLDLIGVSNFVLGLLGRSLAVSSFLLLIFGRVAGLILLVVAGSVAAAGDHLACPSCHQWFAREFQSRELLSKKNRWGTVYDVVSTTHTGTTSDGTTYRGTSSTSVPRTALMTDRKFRENFECKYCGYRWNRILNTSQVN